MLWNLDRELFLVAVLKVGVLVRGGFALEPRTSFSSEAAEVSAGPRLQNKSLELEDQIAPGRTRSFPNSSPRWRRRFHCNYLAIRSSIAIGLISANSID